MSGRAETLIRDWETRLHANALASQILATLNERKSEVQRCALDGLARENPQNGLERANHSLGTECRASSDSVGRFFPRVRCQADAHRLGLSAGASTRYQVLSMPSGPTDLVS
jgi:hypothetical protein